MLNAQDLSAFKDMTRNAPIGILPDLRAIATKGRPKRDCPKWYAEGIEQADFAYQTNTGWKLTQKGLDILQGMT